jgi:hypothetical protein
VVPWLSTAAGNGGGGRCHDGIRAWDDWNCGGNGHDGGAGEDVGELHLLAGCEYLVA